MPRSYDIAGWAFNADVYCDDHAPGDRNPDPDDPLYRDSEHYPQPIFCGDEGLDSCTVCGALLDTSWSGYEVDRAREMLTDYAHNGHGSRDFCDQLAEHLSWCVLDFPAMLALARYQRVTTDDPKGS